MTSRCVAPTFPRASSAVTSPATRATPSARVTPPGRSSRPTGARSGYRYSAWPPLSTRAILVSMLRVGGDPSVQRDAPRPQMTASRRRTARWCRTASIRPLRHATQCRAGALAHTHPPFTHRLYSRCMHNVQEATPRVHNRRVHTAAQRGWKVGATQGLHGRVQNRSRLLQPLWKCASIRTTQTHTCLESQRPVPLRSRPRCLGYALCVHARRGDVLARRLQQEGLQQRRGH